MDEQHALRTLLADAADAAGPFIAPESLHPHRSARRPTPLLVAACVAMVVALAAALAFVPHGDSTQSAPDKRGLQLRAADPTGSAVGVAALSKYRWRTLPLAPIPTRTDPAVVWTGTRMLVWGGAIGNDLRNDGASYDPARRTWTMLPPAPLTPRTGMASAWVDGSFVIWGGDDETLRPVTDGARYDVGTNRWTKLPPAPGLAPGLPTMTVVRHGVVLTAVDQNSKGSATITAVAYRPATNTWQRLPQLSLPKGHLVNRVDLVATDGLVVWAYWAHTVQDVPNGSRTTFGVDVRELDPAGTGWQRSRYDPGGLIVQPFWTGHSLILMGADIWCGGCSHPASLRIPSRVIDARSGRRTVVVDPPGRRVYPSYAWTGAAVIGLLTITADGRMRPGDFAAWNPTTNRWTELPVVAGLAELPQAVWAGDRLLVWGGEPSPGHRAIGAEFAPAAK